MPDLRSIRVSHRLAAVARFSSFWVAHTGPASPDPSIPARSQAGLPRRGDGEVLGPGTSHALQPTGAGGPRVRGRRAAGRPAPRRSPAGRARGYSLTLRQTCSWPRPRAQFAFKDSMIHVQCRSHYVSHFAAFFIVARAKISVVESCLGFRRAGTGSTPAPPAVLLLQ